MSENKQTFRLERTGEIVDPIQHSLEMISQFAKRKKWEDELKIYVGCDSQNRRYSTSYVTVVAYRYGNKGAHFIYTRDNVKKIKERWPRLWGEVERALEVANLLKNNNIPVFCVDLDFNEKEIARSSDMVKAARGYVIGSGYNCTVKPSEQVASRAADHLVRG